MKNKLKKLALILAIGVTFFSCAKDEYSEEDALKALQEISLQVSVRDAGDADSPVADAHVQIVKDAAAVSAQTNEFGVATFENVKISGSISVYVSKDNYTPVYTTVYTVPDDYRQTVVTSNISIYSLTGDNIATINGTISAETDLTNRTPELLSGVEVLAYNNNIGSTKNYFVGVTDESGNYSISVPVRSSGNDQVYVYFPKLELQRTVGRNINNIYSLETKASEYVAGSYSVTSVDAVPSALLEIAEPPTAGTGFQLGLKAVRVSLSAAIDNETADEAILTGGTGYSGVETFVFNADPDGNAAELTVGVTNGVITSISIIDNGATYASLPTINTSPTNGSGAMFDLRFRSQYRVYIQNAGSGYLTFPQVGVDYATAPDNTSKLMSQYYEDMDSFNPLGGGDLYNNAFISNGKIMVADETLGDTLFTTGYVYALPVFTYTNEDLLSSLVYVNSGAIDATTGAISDNFGILISGKGYDFSNPPAVTLTALAGYGSGAVIKSEVNSNGEVSDLVVMVKGSGYVKDINDYDDDGNSYEETSGFQTGFNYWTTGEGRHYNVKPGMVYTGDSYYGTGRVK